MALKLSQVSEASGGLAKTDFLGPHPRVSETAGVNGKWSAFLTGSWVMQMLRAHFRKYLYKNYVRTQKGKVKNSSQDMFKYLMSNIM